MNISMKIIFLFLVLNSVFSVYANECSNVISSNLIDETIAISDTQTISISPLPIIQLISKCTYNNGWNISSNIAFKESGNNTIFEIDDTFASDANLTLEKNDYIIEFGRFDKNFSYNSVIGFAYPMGALPAIQLDEASYNQTVSPGVNMVRLTKKTEFGSIYVSGYHADKVIHEQSNLHNSFNLGVIKSNNLANIEIQYAYESIENVTIKQSRLSLFGNMSGSLMNQRKWGFAAEVNGFYNHEYLSDNDEVTANLYSELSQQNIIPNFDAYVSAGGSYKEINQISLELGIFLNISRLLNMSKIISIKAGAAQSYTSFETDKHLTTNRFSIQFVYGS